MKKPKDDSIENWKKWLDNEVGNVDYSRQKVKSQKFPPKDDRLLIFESIPGDSLRDKLIWIAYKCGISQKEIGEVFNLSQRSISEVLKKIDLTS